jgi:hypothetical protein
MGIQVSWRAGCAVVPPTTSRIDSSRSDPGHKVTSSTDRGVRVSETIADARRLIENRLAEIRAEASDLQRALVGLTERSDPRPSRPRRRRKRVATKRVSAAAPTPGATPTSRTAPRRKTAKRAARGERREQLLAAIKARPGARPSELAEEIGIRPTQVSVLIAKLRGERLIVKDGKGYRSRS